MVEQQPVAAQRLAAAVEAALGEDAALVAPVEPDEPLAVPAHVCAQVRTLSTNHSGSLQVVKATNRLP